MLVTWTPPSTLDEILVREARLHLNVHRPFGQRELDGSAQRLIPADDGSRSAFVIDCDPVLAQLSRGGSGVLAFTKLPQAEDKIRVTNGAPADNANLA